VPPSSWYNGWPAFFVSLVFIGIWTAVVGELASLFGCVVGLGDAITAITFVALGTSLPDTFASRLAMLHDEYADASVGNVTGSNSVNVFLGLGIPWVIGSLYHRLAPNGKGQYDVPAGALGFSVALFCAIACVAILTLVGRRILTGGEIGGSYLSSRLASLWFSTLWLIYIVLASLNIKGIIDIEV
jgi:solute carrier family 8 (sodium/calcium exchanger)